MLTLNADNVFKTGACIMREDAYALLLECEYKGIELLRKHLDDFLLPAQIDNVYMKLSVYLSQERPSDCTCSCDPIFSFQEIELQGERWCVLSHYYEKTGGFRKVFDSSIAFRVRKDYDTLYFRVDSALSYAGFKFLESEMEAPVQYCYHDFTETLICIRRQLSGKRLELLDGFFERIRPASVATKFNAALRFAAKTEDDFVEITAYINGRVSHRLCIDLDQINLQ